MTIMTGPAETGNHRDKCALALKILASTKKISMLTCQGDTDLRCLPDVTFDSNGHRGKSGVKLKPPMGCGIMWDSSKIIIY